MSTILSARGFIWVVGAVPILLAICALLPYVSRCLSKDIAETAEVKTETSLTTRKEYKLRKQHQAALGKKFRKRRVTKSMLAFMFRFLLRTVMGLEAAVDHYQVILCMFMAVCYQSDAKSMVPYHFNCVRMRYLLLWRGSMIFVRRARFAFMGMLRLNEHVILIKSSPAVCLCRSWLYHMRLVGFLGAYGPFRISWASIPLCRSNSIAATAAA